MKAKELRKLLRNVAKGTVTAETAQKKIEKAAAIERVRARLADTTGCRY